jgi:hypothetical protein
VKALTVPCSRDHSADAIADDGPEHIIDGQRYAWEWRRARGRRLESLPFAATAHHAGTIDNDSGGGLLHPGMPHLRHSSADLDISSPKGPLSTWWSVVDLAAFTSDRHPRHPFFLSSRDRGWRGGPRHEEAT